MRDAPGSSDTHLAEPGATTPASAGELHVARLLHDLVAGTDEIVELANAGSLEDAFARIELRNECFDQLQSAMSDLRGGAEHGEQFGGALTELMLSAREAQERLLAAIADARDGVRNEIRSVRRGASAAGAYERAAAPPGGHRFETRR